MQQILRLVNNNELCIVSVFAFQSIFFFSRCFRTLSTLYPQFNVRLYLNLTFSRFQIKHHYFSHGLFAFSTSPFKAKQ